MAAWSETVSVKRVFINSVDSYSSGNIAKFLSECLPRAPADPAEEHYEKEKEENMCDQSRERRFHVVGTVYENVEEVKSYLHEQYTVLLIALSVNLNRDDLLSKLMDCDVVIYNISQHAGQVEEALWAVTALHDQIKYFSGPKMFILISTVMTWACSKPVDPDYLELQFTDKVFWKRRAHPNFKHHIDVEKRVVKLGKTNRKLFSTYVVASGLQYGMGEQIFHFFFKTSWLGQKPFVPLFGDGKNIVPTVHVNDLASVVQNVIEDQPQPYYLLAVDRSKNTMEEIIRTICSALGLGKIQKKPFEEAFLVKDLSAMEADSLQVNLRMDATLTNELFSVNWSCEDGLVVNMEKVVDEYRNTRGLLPLHVCVVGPPAVGKTSFCKHFSDLYKVHHISLKETIAEGIAQLEFLVKNSDPESATDESAAAEELLFSLKESMKQNRGLLEDHLLVRVLRIKLTSNPCKNQGFILDGFPKTFQQAKELFSDEDHYPDTTLTASHSSRIIPELVLVLDATDSFLQDRVMNLPERIVQEQNYEQDLFLQRLDRYRDRNLEDETVLNFFDELDVPLLNHEVTNRTEPHCLQLMQKIISKLGPPRTYSRSREEVEEEEKRKEEERMRREAQERAQEKRRDEEEAGQRAAHWEEWTKRLEEVRQQEEELLEVQSISMRTYLMEQVMPTLRRGLIECCTARPNDPVDFLAEFLLRNNPSDY